MQPRGEETGSGAAAGAVALVATAAPAVAPAPARNRRRVTAIAQITSAAPGHSRSSIRWSVPPHTAHRVVLRPTAAGRANRTACAAAASVLAPTQAAGT